MPVAITSETTSNIHPSVDRKSTNPRPKKTRVVRRRGRAQNGLGSDDEIEREVGSDSETDGQSSLDSDSETESASDDDAHLNGRSEVVTPSTTRSPPPEIGAHASLNGSKPHSSVSEAGPFVSTTNWADMVSDGKEELPVIDFADLNGHELTAPPAAPSAVLVHASRSSKQRPGKQATFSRSLSAPPTSPPAPPPQPIEAGTGWDAPIHGEEAGPSHSGPSGAYDGSSRPRGQSARQAYQERLDTDPSFVPRVGGFWGHDDRLLDKDLRSLSGWWRGRGRGSRGHGGGGFAMRGRGRGGYFGGQHSPQEPQGEGGPGFVEPEVPAIEQTWTHDGFEEMKRRDEQRRLHQEQPFRGGRGLGFRGRGGFASARGRGGFNRGATASPLSRQTDSPTMTSGRIWYVQKPERVWTKQHEAFLYFDPNLKPRPGQGPGFRIKVAGKEEQIVRTAPRPFGRTTLGHARTTSVQSDGAPSFVVRIPRPGKAKAAEETTVAVVEELATTVGELSIDEVFTVRPNIAPTRADIPVLSAPEQKVQPARSTAPVPPAASAVPPILSQPQTPEVAVAALQPSMESFQAAADTGPSLQILESILRNPSSVHDGGSQPGLSPESQHRPVPPALHPLQTSFSPVPQPQAPPYGSPYPYAAVPALPPGIAMNQHGMPYEMATGRAVYIQPTPPPMFTPRPMMHMRSGSVPFVPAYMQPQHQPSPAFDAHPHTPPVHGYVDPSPGVPIFTPARQSSRIEIRAPTEGAEGKKAARPSGLRASVSSAGPYPDSVEPQPSHARNGSSELPGGSATDGSVEDAHMNGALPPAEQPHYQVEQGMMYNPYQQQYYYPEYGYPAPYMEMSPQVQYEMYPPPPAEHHAPPPPPMIYY